jgi:hypothetical protein
MKSDSPKVGATMTKGAAAEEATGSGKFGYKVLASVGAALSAGIARKVVTAGWRRMTGKEPPKNPEHPDQRLGEAVGWAAASAGAIAAARVLAQRRVAQTWRKASGTLPPGMTDETK